MSDNGYEEMSEAFRRMFESADQSQKDEEEKQQEAFALMAKLNMECFKEHMDAGFTVEQALRLTNTYLSTILTISTKGE